MLLFSGALPFTNLAFGPGVGNIYLDNVQCSGTEAELFDCMYHDIGGTSCTHATDAAVRCQGKA